MKYFLRILLTLVLAVAVIYAVYYRTVGNPFEKQDTSLLTTASQPPATEKNANRVLIASLPGEDYKLYKGSRSVVLVHEKKEYEFTNWSRLIDVEAPEMYLKDYDGDGTEELLIRAVSAKNETTGELSYDIYLLTPMSGRDGYLVFPATQTTWSDILDAQIREEITQLKSCKKILQVSMNAKSKTINYDTETGIAQSGYNGYARALQNGASYLTFKGWSKGKGVYTVNNKKEICVSVEVNIHYNESDTVQTAGHINFKLDFKNGRFFVKNKSMNFTPDKAYRVSDPRTVSETGWKYRENNADKGATADRVIDWIKYTPDYSSDTLEQTISLAAEQTDIRDIANIQLTDSYLELTAKAGCSFDTGARKRGEYSVVINRGSDSAYDIAYDAKVMEINGAEVLRIRFDKSYPQNEIHTVEINYGGK